MAICSYLENDTPEDDAIDRVHLSNELIGLVAKKD
jgi:hypothetical protein